MDKLINSKEEKGSITVLAVIMLVLLTLLGMAALSTSSIETQVAGNDMRSKLALYAAESGAAYVAERTDLYGSENITPGAAYAHSFPNNPDPYSPIIGSLPTPQPVDATANQSFNGTVQYQRGVSPPRGSGYAVGKFKAHEYLITSNGYHQSNARESIMVGFYRIGF